MPGATGWALISNQYIDCTQPGQIPGFARRLGSDTIAYSISEAAFTIQFGSYQPPPIPYLDFAWLSRNRTFRKRKELGYSRRRSKRDLNAVNLIARHQDFVPRYVPRRNSFSFIGTWNVRWLTRHFKSIWRRSNVLCSMNNEHVLHLCRFSDISSTTN